MMKKMLAAFLAVTMAGTMLAGCGTGGKDQQKFRKEGNRRRG